MEQNKSIMHIANQLQSKTINIKNGDKLCPLLIPCSGQSWPELLVLSE